MAPKSDTKRTLTGTDLLHADDGLGHGAEVAPSISVTSSKSLDLRMRDASRQQSTPSLQGYPTAGQQSAQTR